MNNAMNTSDDPFLSKETLWMRRALAFCSLQANDINYQYERMDSDILEKARVAADSIVHQRQEAFKLIHSSNEVTVPTIGCFSKITPENFKRQYIRTNQPCKIMSIDGCFDKVRSKWVTCENLIDSSWFLHVLGPTCQVPVRFITRNETELDAKGRAAECSTQHMTCEEWLRLVKNDCNPLFYLKDWHLVQYVRHHKPEQLPLYHVPLHFQDDLLNDLLQFSDSDYFFCYWGPKGSFTGKHSDVMNSFSWSYNVCGTKEWEFFIDDDSSCKVVQKTGECIFVPAGWKHVVVNLEETISINHNWITTANVDLVWECILIELKDVEEELAKWEIDCGNLGACESMLLGCLGLNVTGFFFLLVLGIIKGLNRHQISEEFCFDLIRLSQTLQAMFDRKDLKMFARLNASLADTTMANSAVEIATNLLKLCTAAGC
jgi:hypothetical protein